MTRIRYLKTPPRPDRVTARKGRARERSPGAVSNGSLFADAEWYFETETGGYGGVVVLRWALEKPEEAWLDDREWADLIHEAKLFVLSLKERNQRGENVKAEGLPSVYYRSLYLVRWMAKADITSFAKITPDVAESFLEDLRWAKGRGAEDPRALDTLASYVDIVCRLYEQRVFTTSKRGERMPEHPFRGQTAFAVAGKIADRKERRGWIQPVPDEVWLPTVTAALAWLEEPARLVVQLGEIVIGVDESTPDLPADGGHMWGVALADDGVLSEWLKIEAQARWPGLRPDRYIENAVVRRLYKMLLSDLRDACTIVVQAMLGLRISEVAGLKAEPLGKETGWPDCVHIGPSLSGLNEIFYVKGYVFKGKPNPEPTDWVAGSRPLGTPHLPSAVKALLVLEEAFRYWRRRWESEELLVGLGGGLHRTAIDRGVAEIASASLAAGQQRFVRRRVELPDSHRQWRLSTHQWRKSFALYMVRSDERSLAAVSDHFKHLSVASTDQSYVGTDAELLGLMNDAGVRSAARTLLDACEGKTTVSGRMAETVEKRAPDILKACKAFGPEAQKIDSLTAMLNEDDIRVWTSDWGRCLFRAEKARCHIEAEGKIESRARQPNQAHRHPNVCCGCANLLVTDAHGDFWRERKIENRALVLSCTNDGNLEGAAAAKHRATVAEDILAKLQRRADRKKPKGGDAGS